MSMLEDDCDWYDFVKFRKLNVDNAKLRELCTDMHAWMSRALYESSARKHEYELMTERMDDLGVPHD